MQFVYPERLLMFTQRGSAWFIRILKQQYLTGFSLMIFPPALKHVNLFKVIEGNFVFRSADK